jgi:hypothetical protein
VRRAAWVLALLIAGCGDDDYVYPPDLLEARDLSATPDLLTPANRGPAMFPLSAPAGGLYWDVPTQSLYIASGSNQILRFTDDGMTHVVATVPLGLAPAQNSLGQLLRLADGTIVVTSNGFGQYGAVFIVHVDGTIDSVANLDTSRRRIGITLAADGQLYDTWYVQNPNGTIGAAGVAKVDPSAGETDLLMNNLGRPIGIAAGSDRLYVSDQLFNKIWFITFVSPGSLTAFATPMGPGLLVNGRNSGLLVTAPTGVNEVDATGKTTLVLMSPQKVDAVAYDRDHQRVFFAAAADPDADAGGLPMLHIEPLD